jgi:seryl-tRNA synthetase
MIVQIIPTRYTVSGKVLYECLEEMFGAGKVQVFVRSLSSISLSAARLGPCVQELQDGDNWKIQVPRELTEVSRR